MNNAIKIEKFSLSSRLYYRKNQKSKKIKKLLYCYNVFLKTCLVILKTVFLFCDSYIAMTDFTKVDTRLKSDNQREF